MGYGSCSFNSNSNSLLDDDDVSWGGDVGSSAGGSVLGQPPPLLVIFGSGANGSYAPPQVGGKLCASFASLARYRLVAVEQQQA